MKASFSHISSLFLLVVLGMLFLTCAGPNGGSNENSPNEDTLSANDPQSELRFNGTVQYRELEGGAWVIVGEDGTTYEPTNLPEAYREKGLPVRVWADRLEDQASIRMVGPIIAIERIERRQ